MPRANLVETVLRACRADAVLGTNPRVVVGVSGGPDSTALLHALARARRRLGLDVSAAHFDHGWRPGAPDAGRVAELCAELRLPLELGRAAAPVRRAEAAARDARHAFLEGVAARAGAATVALGHTSDDQAETVLLHLIRGTGLEGLAAMAVREGPRFRPLLGTSRAEVEAYCTRHRLAPLDDPSNADPGFARNRVRAELLPLLEDFNPAIRAALVRLAEAARAEHEVVSDRAAAWLHRRRRPLPRAAYATLPVAVRVEVLRRVWTEAAGGGVPEGDAARLRQADLLVSGGRKEGMTSLGRGLHLYVQDGVFHVA
ncbi:MAG: tRNA(Ile)-lysidine synthase [Chloroflexota bacterium]|jgi:tRNA(Ile)-lysidine synthase|nr:tRNA(Ile)-lysidine synthase [Chloroflexota bacterium]